MKRLLGIVLGVSIWLSLVLGVVDMSSLDASFYTDRYTELDTATNIGVSTEDLKSVTQVLIEYLQGARSDLDVNVTLNGQSQAFFNERELAHMVDVQVLFVKTINLRNIALVSVVLCLIAIFLIAKKQMISVITQGIIDASMVLGTAFLALMAYALIDFNAFWIQFHQTLFTNDLWYLNPNTDNLILLVPEPFFIALVGIIIYRIVLGFSLIAFVLYALNQKGLNARHLKWFALATMVVDHVGHFLLPHYLELRFLGRFAFPIFTFLFAISYRKTSNRKSLIVRVGIAAVLGQLLITYFGASELVSIFFLFLLGTLVFEAIDRHLIWAIIPLALTAEIFGVDYGWYGILVLANFYAFHGSFKRQALGFTLLTLISSFSPFINPNIWPMIPTIFQNFFSTYYRYFIQVFSVVALIPLAFYKSEKPQAYPQPYASIETYFFYVFYPVHIALLALMRSGVL